MHIIVQGNEEGHTNKHKSLGESNMNKIEDEEIKPLKKGSRKMEIEKWKMEWKDIKWKTKGKKYHLQFNRCSNHNTKTRRT